MATKSSRANSNPNEGLAASISNSQSARKDLPAEHIEAFTGVEEEMADTIIRVLDFCARHELHLGEAIAAKMQYNLMRPFMHRKKY